jgi:quinol monooxygenase YgiN
MEAVQLDFYVTPWRAERFFESYQPAVARVLAYGAGGYVFLRADENPNHFMHISWWEDRRDFERYWLSDEMREMRRKLSGLYDLTSSLPHWSTFLERG